VQVELCVFLYFRRCASKIGAAIFYFLCHHLFCRIPRYVAFFLFFYRSHNRTLVCSWCHCSSDRRVSFNRLGFCWAGPPPPPPPPLYSYTSLCDRGQLRCFVTKFSSVMALILPALNLPSLHRNGYGVLHEWRPCGALLQPAQPLLQSDTLNYFSTEQLLRVYGHLALH
jgi:hypothetical protein